MLFKININIAQLIGMFKEFKLITKAKIKGYHQSIDTLPIYNWFKCEDGELNYICKKKLKGYPIFFKRIFHNMHFEFDKMDNSGIRDVAKLKYLESLYLTEKNPRFLNMARSLEEKLKTQAKTKHKKRKLNDLINLVEETNKQIGAIDPHKMTTTRFFSLYNRVIDKAKANQHGNN